MHVYKWCYLVFFFLDRLQAILGAWEWMIVKFVNATEAMIAWSMKSDGKKQLNYVHATLFVQAFTFNESLQTDVD